MTGAAFPDRVNRPCAALPGAGVSDPRGGHVAWKVRVSVACADTETAALLIESGIARPAPCFHRSRVNPPDSADPAERAHRRDTSHQTIRAGLPRRIRESLAARPA